jgi:hypothetical protein
MEAIATAYGYLWHVNNEPMAPIPLYSPETAAHEARKILRDLMSHEQRGEAINRVQKLLGHNVVISGGRSTSAAWSSWASLPEGEQKMTEQEAFEKWCPYRGSPDPRVVWAAAWAAATAPDAGEMPRYVTQCWGCEGKPSGTNNPCDVCGRHAP